MPVTVESGVSGPFIPNGVATAFAFNFKADSATEVIVVDENGDELSSGLYSVTLNLGEGGTVTFSVAPALADYAAIFIVSAPAMTQESDFGNAGPSFNPASLTRALDRAAIRDLFLQAQIDRAIKVPFGDTGTALPADRAGLFLSFDAGNNPIASSGTGADAGLRTDIAADNGTSLIASKRDASAYRRLQEAKNKDQRPHLFDMTPGALHAAILAGTSTESINEFMSDAATLAIAEGYPVVQLPPGQAVISDTVFLDSGQSFLGVGFEGPGVENLVLLQDFDAGDTEKPIFRMRGGSGSSTNKKLSGFSVKPAAPANNGRGQLIEIDGQNFATVENVYGENLHTLIAFANRTVGNFTEKCIVRDVRALDCQRGVSFIRYAGNDSFHGPVFDGLCQINIPDGGYGLWLEGVNSSNLTYLYNSSGEFRMFGGTGTRTAIYCENAITQNLDYRFTVEGACKIEIADADSRFHSKGCFESTHAVTLDAVANGQILFENLRNGSAFASSPITSFSPQVLPSALADRNSTGDFPTVFKMADNALGFGVFNNAGGGSFFGYIPFNGKLEAFVPTWKLDHDGVAIRNFNSSFEVRVGAAGTTLSGTFDGDGLNLDTGNVYKIGGTQVVGARGAAVADATDAASVIARLNELLARCRAHGLIAT